MNKNKLLLGLSLIVFLLGIVFGATFFFDKSAWNNTQDFIYGLGTGQERVISEFEIDLSKCGGVGTVYDKVTNLCWQKNMSSHLDYDGTDLNWTDAVNYCNNLVTQGGNWRLPEKAELLTLVFHNGEDSTQARLMNIGFSNVQDYYWSNTKSSVNKAYILLFNWGYSHSNNDIRNSYAVVCVKTAP